MDTALTCYLLFQALLAAYLLLDGFDLGAGIISLFTKSEDNRRKALYAIWPVWNANEVWILAAFVLLFAAFPLVFTTLLSSLYAGFFLFLAAIILRGVFIEYRERASSERTRRIFTALFGIGSLLAAFCLGVVAGNCLLGFPMDERHLLSGGALFMFNAFSLATGLLAVLLLAWQGAAWLTVKAGPETDAWTGKLARWILPSVLVLWAGLALWLLIASPTFPERLERPVLTALLAAGFPACFVLSVLLRGRSGGRMSFFLSSLSIVSLLAASASAFYPVLIPSLSGLGDLTVSNASSDPRALRTVLGLLLAGLPFVALLNGVVYWIFRGRPNLRHE
jgi:cytochrome d ubiquinol oxidase subunit II